jgi:transposase
MLKQLASSICHAAQEANAKVVFIEDITLPWNPTGGDPSFVKMVKRMPWSDAETILRHELDEHGIRLQKVAQAHDVSKCPSCGAATKITDDYVDCSGCGILCDRQIIATWNMFLASGVPVTDLVETKRKASFITRAMRKKEHELASTHLEKAVQPAAE